MHSPIRARTHGQWSRSATGDQPRDPVRRAATRDKPGHGPGLSSPTRWAGSATGRSRSLALERHVQESNGASPGGLAIEDERVGRLPDLYPVAVRDPDGRGRRRVLSYAPSTRDLARASRRESPAADAHRSTSSPPTASTSCSKHRIRERPATSAGDGRTVGRDADRARVSGLASARRLRTAESRRALDDRRRRRRGRECGARDSASRLWPPSFWVGPPARCRTRRRRVPAVAITAWATLG